MKLSLKNDAAMKKTETIKAALAATQTQNLTFSYTTKKSPTTIELKQRETGFLLAITIEKLDQKLRVTRFALNNLPQLEAASIALYDAAIIEIVLEALRTLFITAHRQSAKEMVFILKDEEAKHLTSFESFLETCTSSMTDAGKSTTFTLFSCEKAQNLLLEKAEYIKTQVKHELWKAQRLDPFLKNYLQSHPKGELLSCCQPKTTEITPIQENVLAFPFPKNC